MKRKTLLITAACLVLALSTTVAVRKAGSARQPQGAAPAANIVEFLQADLVRVARQDLRLSLPLPLSGSLRALNQASVKAKVSGEVKQVLVREGEPVRGGQVIVRIGSKPRACGCARF